MARTKPDPIQEQLIQARRNQILDAATQVFAAKGFHRATIRDIATVAGIADGTIYNYFENKTALLLGLLNRIGATDQREHMYEQATHGDVRSFIRSYIRQRFEVIPHVGFEVFQVLFSEILVNSELRDLFYQQVLEPTFAITEHYFRQWEEQGLIKLRDTRLSLRLASGTAFGLIFLRILGDAELQARWNEIPDLVADFLLEGVEFNDGDTL